MATPITRDALNEEVNTRFWAQTGYKVGKPLDPQNPADKAMAKVWLAIRDQVQKEAQAGTLVITHYQPEVIEALADAQVANDVAAEHLRAAAASTDPETANQHAMAAAAAVQTATAKARDARAGQELKVPPEIMQQAAREATAAPPPPSAPVDDHIAHVQIKNNLASNGTRSSDAPSAEALYTEANNRFWRQYNYKPGQKLDMSNFQDQLMAEAWTTIFHDVEREAREGRLVMTPPPSGVPQDPYAEPQGAPPQDFSQPQYGAYGAPPGLTPPQAQPQYAPPQPEPQYGAYGSPPGMTPPQYGAPQGFPQEPQYAAQQGFPQAPSPQEIPVPQYGASQQITPPQYGSPQDFSMPQNGASQGFPTPSQADFQAPQMPQASQMGQPSMQQGFPQASQDFQPPQMPPQMQPQAQQPQAQQPRAPQGMEGFPPDLLQYAQQQAQQPQQAPQAPEAEQVPQAAPQPPLNFQTPRGGADSAPRPSTAITPPVPAASENGWSRGAKIGVAVAAFGGILAVAYAASRRSGARIQGTSPREASYLALLPSRSGRH